MSDDIEELARWHDAQACRPFTTQSNDDWHRKQRDLIRSIQRELREAQKLIETMRQANDAMSDALDRTFKRAESQLAERDAQVKKLASALKELLEQVESLDDVVLTRDVELYKAQANWNDAISRAENALQDTP